MTDYIIRVELHHEKQGDYPKLHAEMEQRGFFRTIVSGAVTYHMPHATYLMTSNSSSQDVYNLAAQAVAAIGRQAGIVVAPSAYSQMWVGGLIPV